MNRILARMIRGAITGFVGLSAILVLLLLSVAFVLWRDGALTAERLDGALQALRGVKHEVSAVPPGVPEGEWAKIQEADRRRRENLTLQEKDLKHLREINAARLEQLKRERAELDSRIAAMERERDEFAKNKQALEQKQKDDTFKNNLRRYQETPAKTLIELWLSLTDAEIVRYLRAMRPDVVSDLLKAMSKSAAYTRPQGEPGQPPEPSRLESITKLMQQPG